jgi:ribosomal protein L37AE/L43A
MTLFKKRYSESDIQDKFKNGECPECGGNLILYRSGSWDSNWICSGCKVDFQFIGNQGYGSKDSLTSIAGLAKRILIAQEIKGWVQKQNKSEEENRENMLSAMDNPDEFFENYMNTEAAQREDFGLFKEFIEECILPLDVLHKKDLIGYIFEGRGMRT